MALPILDQGIDDGIKEQALRRLARIEGQVRGLRRMIEDDRYCVDVLTQISSVHEALRGVSRLMMENYLRRCASKAIRAGGERAEEVRAEILDLMYKYAK
jgi:DNA-binding FrmR family transcriptional regulator